MTDEPTSARSREAAISTRFDVLPSFVRLEDDLEFGAATARSSWACSSIRTGPSPSRWTRR